MLYKLPKQKPTMSDEDRVIVAVMIMVGLPTIIVFIGTFLTR